MYPQIYDSEGFFVARIRKLTSVVDAEKTFCRKNFPFVKLNHKAQAQVMNALSESLSISLPDQSALWQRDNVIWLFPEAIEPLLTEIRFERIGIKLAETHKKGFRWQHEAVIALASGQESCCVNIDAELARDWFMGRDIRPEHDSGKGEVIVCYRNKPIGLGKWVGNKIKNNLPRDLVKDKNLFVE